MKTDFLCAIGRICRCHMAGLLMLLPTLVFSKCLELWDPALCHDAHLTLLPQHSSTSSPACLDGSPYGVYHRPSPTNSTKFTMFLQGGGWCYNERDCLERSKTDLGSSTNWPSVSGCGCMNLRTDGSIDDTCNCIWLEYCDGASFSGFREQLWPVAGTNSSLTFRGLQNVDAALDWAIENAGLTGATDFVLTGGSAGGLATFLHADRVAARVRSVAPGARLGARSIHAVPFTGFFLDHANLKNDSATSYPAKMKYVYRMQNLTFSTPNANSRGGGLSAACEAHHPQQPWLCFMSPHMAGFIKTPFFMFNSRYDQWQLANINQAGWTTPGEKAAVIRYGADFLTQWRAAIVPPNGAMITTCICHACNWTSFVLGGKNSYRHYADWVTGKTQGNASLHVDLRAPNGGGTMVGPHCAPFAHKSSPSRTRQEESAPPTAPWTQDRFVISFWVDPIVPPAKFSVEYARIAAANFTVLLGGFGATTPDTVALQVAAATQAGLAAIPSGCGGSCENATGVWGTQLKDEPAVRDFAALAPAVARVKAAGRVAFVNLLPNYASTDELNASSYGEYLARYIAEVQPNMLCVDHYPNFDKACDSTGHRANKTKDGYVRNLLALRAASLASTPPVPFWNFFNTMPYGTQASAYDVSEAELRWQVWTSVALGAKGVLYFCYWTPPGSVFLRGGAIMTPRGAPDTPYASLEQAPSDHYWQAQRINSKLKVIGSWLLPMRSTAVAQLAANASVQALLLNGEGRGLGPLTGVTGTSTGAGWETTIGFFALDTRSSGPGTIAREGQDSFLLVNADSDRPAFLTLDFEAPFDPFHGALLEMDERTGRLITAVDAAPLLKGFQVSLIAGDAKLFVYHSMRHTVNPTAHAQNF